MFSGSSAQTSNAIKTQPASHALAPTNELDELDELWLELAAGRGKIVSSGVTREHHYFFVQPVADANLARPVAPLKLERLFRVLLGIPQKALALDNDASLSTIATQVADCLQAFGLARRSHRVPLALVVLVHVVSGRLRRDTLQVKRRSDSEGVHWLVRCARPELGLGSRLSQGELAVISGLIEGKTYLEIGRSRQRATRTVANQVASAYAKLAISGRSELLCALAGMLEAEPPLSSRGAERTSDIRHLVVAAAG